MQCLKQETQQVQSAIGLSYFASHLSGNTLYWYQPGKVCHSKRIEDFTNSLGRYKRSDFGFENKLVIQVSSDLLSFSYGSPVQV